MKRRAAEGEKANPSQPDGQVKAVPMREKTKTKTPAAAAEWQQPPMAIIIRIIIEEL